MEMTNAGWYLAFENCCFVSQKPVDIKMVGGVLHCIDGPSVRFASGFSVYSFRGTRIPGEWIEDPDCLTAEIALSQDRVELRTAACELLGWDKILEQLNPKSIDKDLDEEIGELLMADLVGQGEQKFLKAKCGTGRTIVLPVPDEMETALQANAWTYGLNPEELNLEVRT